MVSELMAYMYLIHIVRDSKDLGDMVWINYDMALWCLTDSVGSRQWSRINLSLYSICFIVVA